MKRIFKAFALLLLIAPVFLIVSCKKEEPKKEDLAAIKEGWVTGTWKQTDITLAYSIPFGGQDLPVGFSLHNIAGYLPVSGPKITATKDNVFTFDPKGTFSITGSTGFMMPNVGNTGTWNLQVYGSALHLISSDGKDTPLWIEDINATNMKLGSLSNTVNIFEADPPDGADIPVYFIFEKQ